MSFEKDSKKFWVELCSSCKEHKKFLFKDPSPMGMCKMLVDLTTKEKRNVVVYYNTCRTINEEEYVTYKLLGYLDE